MSSQSGAPALDLLQPYATWRIDLEGTRVAVNMAFAGGVAGGLFSEALEKSSLPASSWDPSSFAGDLFLPRFVNQCLRVQVGRHEPLVSTAYLTRLLAQPPNDPHVVGFRREILAELTDRVESTGVELRARFERLYLDLCRLRGLLENADNAKNWDPSRRQLDILAVLKQLIDGMSEGFQGARSGLRRLGQFGAAVQNSEAYRALADLLSFDGKLATLHLQVEVGADGRLRGFQIEKLHENQQNPFVNSVWRRWLAKFELFLRGYRFGDGEILARLIDAVFSGLDEVVVSLVQLLGDLEFYLAGLSFKDRAEAAGLSVCLPEIVAAEEPRVLLGLFNPFLLGNGVVPVPCDLISSSLASTVLVTGPNSGGKTRLLQAVGLTQVLAQSGLFIPARAGAVALTRSLVVSLLEETKSDQTEGRLGMELMRIRSLFERLPPGAMVLLDELCSGTNPSEGEEIFELVVSMLGRLSPQAFITTHFLMFAARLERERRIPNLEFLQVELGADRRPTYQFAPGVASTSLAGRAAERLGVTAEQLAALIHASVAGHRAGAVAGVQG